MAPRKLGKMATRKQPNDAVLQLLGDLKSDMNRSFDQLHDGQVKMFDLFSAHVAEDKKQFDEIKEAVNVAKGAKEAEIDAAKKSADIKLLGVTAIGGGGFIFELLRYLHVIQ